MLRRGHRSRIEVRQVALSDRDGTARLRVPHLDTGYASIEPENTLTDHTPEHVRTIEVPTRRLDALSLEDVGFMKVDVEGHEEAVLRGAVETIETNRPNLLLELEERHSAGCIPRVRDLLHQRGYTGVVLRGRTIRSLETFDPVRHQAQEDARHYVRNFIFVPSDREDRVAALHALAAERL
jgi:FkbM family methyltransferase